QAEDALQESEARFRRLADNAQDIIYRYRLISPCGFEYVSPAATAITGYTPEEHYADPQLWLKLVQEEDSQILQHWLSPKVTEPLVVPWICKSGSRIWAEHRTVPIFSEAETLIAVEGIARDITERKCSEEQLREHAFHDALTSLPNRALFMDRLTRAIEHSKRHSDYLFAVLFLDLDRFKVINDSLGHTLGDQLLVAIAGRLSVCLRPTDTVARFGGDEFTLLLENIKDISDVIRVAERIQAELILPFKLGEYEMFITASIGIALNTADCDQPADLLRDADNAMYRAKDLGKARYEIFNTDMHVQAVSRLQLESDLRRALERQEFRIHYQPIVSLFTGQITGFEALVRWQHPTRGLIFPEAFMPTAEETGLSIPIDQWVLWEACRQTHQWQEQFPPDPGAASTPLWTISVNLCSHHFRQPELLQQINQVLQSTHLAAPSLKLEITENLIMENHESATATFAQLKELGIQLSIDDFGTGYSSLGRLHYFPIDVLKIDRSFVSKIGSGNGNFEIAETIVALAQKLGVDVTAEGIETANQLVKLRGLNCSYGQGYFFSQPLDTEAAAALIVSKPRW
ncbi:MAG TPA: EAL domain-containing protein, partial [Candidatus Caenarcaniphilales bacterium]